MRSARNYILEDQFIQFLTSLNDQFSVVKTQVLNMESLQSISKVYSLVAHKENNNIHAYVPVVDESNFFTNAYEAKKCYGRDMELTIELGSFKCICLIEIQY